MNKTDVRPTIRQNSTGSKALLGKFWFASWQLPFYDFVNIYNLKWNCYWNSQISIKNAKRQKAQEFVLTNYILMQHSWKNFLIQYSAWKSMSSIYVWLRIFINKLLIGVYRRQYWSWLGIKPRSPFQVSYH